MSKKNKIIKYKTLPSNLNEDNDSLNKTYLDSSLYNSKLCKIKNGKENINVNIPIGKDKKKKYISKQKEKNFFEALKLLNLENENNNNNKSILGPVNTSKGSKNLLSQISEFSEVIIDKSKDYNISKYLHHPITKQIIKEGNIIIKIKNPQIYRVRNGLEINKPFVSAYNLQNIFEKFNNSFIEIENSKTNSKINENEINDFKKEIIEKKVKSKNKNKKIKYFHKKNKSSITNYYFNESNSTRTIANLNNNNMNNNKNGRYIIHYRNNISSLTGGHNRINFKDKESNTTVTKDDYIKDCMQIHEINDINININIFNNNNNRNLEVINDFDETKDNKMFSTNKKSELNNTSNKKELIIKNEYPNSIPKNIIINNKKGKTSTESKGININENIEQLNIIDLFKEENNNYTIKTFDKLNNYSINKTLRKKYERTEFKFKYVGKDIMEYNNNIMRNLLNKFEQCSDNNTIKKVKKLEKNNKNKIEKSNSSNKNNETFVIKEIDNGFVLNLDVSVKGDSFSKNINIQDNEIASNCEKNIFNQVSKKSTRNAIDSLKSYNYIKNYMYKSNKIKSINTIKKHFSFNLNNSLNVPKRNSFSFLLQSKNNFHTPKSDKQGIKIHQFNLESPFFQNDSSIFKKTNSNISFSKKNKKYSENIKKKSSKSIQSYETKGDPLPQSVYDYTFYQKLLKAEENMTKKYKILRKYEPILNTEQRLEILLWMMKTCEEFAFKRDTYHNSCYYFDMYLIINNQIMTNKSELELIGLTCIVISAKLEEIQLPRLKEYSELLSKKYSIKSIIEMEKNICSKLSWKLIIITKNIWLSWYVCQWDLYIDTIDNIKQDLLSFLNEEDILYYKKPNDNSYYNFRRISQLIDIMTLDYYSYNFEQRILIAASFFILLCYNYKLKYNFNKKKFENNSPLSNLLFEIYNKFITQSFDYNFLDEKLQKAIKYCYNYIDFPFIYDLPLFYQIHQSKLDGDSYEDFLSYQTTNDNYYRVIKERITINKKMKIKNKINNRKNNNKFAIINGHKTIMHRKTLSSKAN